MKGRNAFGLLCALACLLCLTQAAFGAGFGLYEMSARGNALGGAMVARDADPSTVYYNPAGMTQLSGLQTEAGVTLVAPNTHVTTYKNGTSTDTKGKNNTWTVPNAYATYQANDHVWLGLGVFSRFGLGTEFDQNWAGRYNNYDAEIQTLSLNPNIAFKVDDSLSFAFGVEAMSFDLALRKKIDSTGGLAPSLPRDIDSTMKGDNIGYGVNFGLRYQPVKWMALGATYRSQVDQSLKGRATFQRGSAVALPATWFPNTDAQGKITLPESLALGVAFFPIDKLSVEFTATYTGWSSYNGLNISFNDPLRPGVTEADSTKNWRDVWRYAVGVEYKTLPWLDLRAGYVYDEDPVNSTYADYMVPSNNRHIFSFGPGFHIGNFDIDLSYSYLIIQSRTIDARAADGVYASHFSDGDAHIIGLSVGYKF